MQENRPVIALDFPEFSDVKDFLEKFDPSETWYGTFLYRRPTSSILCEIARS